MSDALNALALARTVPPAAPAPFPTARILEGDPKPRPQQHVTGLLLRAEINGWGGFGGSGKTITALYVAVVVVLAGIRPAARVFGSLEVLHAGPVLLVCPEDGEGAVRMMLDAILAGLMLTDDERAWVRERVHIVTDDAVVNLTLDVARLAATAADVGAVLVVLDPLINLLGGATEDDNPVGGTVTDQIRRDVCRGAGATVLLNRHLRKPGKDAPAGGSATVHDFRGGSAWTDGARLVFAVNRREGGITLAAVKSNRLKPGLRHELRLAIETDPADDTLWRSLTLTDANIGTASESLTAGVGRAINENERTALLVLDDTHEPGKRLSWSGWVKASGLNENTFKSLKGRLLDGKLAEAISTGRRARNGGNEYAYAITDAGRAALTTGWVQQRPKGEGVTTW
ncbi:MAG: AAA family ATPase [Gemmatimonadetes bacterium]|nr:AAA family ATPase [Gemmatimonadota bacterium]